MLVHTHTYILFYLIAIEILLRIIVIDWIKLEISSIAQRFVDIFHTLRTCSSVISV